MKKEELDEILTRHKRWLNKYPGWSENDRAVLVYENLRNADLRYADLSYAVLYGTDLYNANLTKADLSMAILSKADLSMANLTGANLFGADLTRANLIGANLSESICFPYIPYACPDFGAFIGFKRAADYIVMLEIPSDAKRLSANGRECRSDKAKVLQIQNLDGSESGLDTVASDFCEDFIYKVGEIVNVPNFDEDRWVDCTFGIHFFINRQEAVNYKR